MEPAMRAKMPHCAAFVDALREAFGVEEINSVIKRGLRMEASPEHRVLFSEAGHVLGSPVPQGVGVTAAQMVIGDQSVQINGARRGGR